MNEYLDRIDAHCERLRKRLSKLGIVGKRTANRYAYRQKRLTCWKLHIREHFARYSNTHPTFRKIWHEK